MVHSMTGYGRASCQIQSSILTVEMKTVNHRFLDITIKMPKQFVIIEDSIKKIIHKYVSRGRVEVYINLDGEALVDKSVQVDWALLDHFVESLNKMNERFSLKEQVTLNHLLTLHESIEVNEKPVINEAIENELLHMIDAAAAKLLHMRKAEGNQLSQDLKEKLGLIKGITTEIEASAPIVVEYYREKIEKRMKELIDGKVDEQRILTEVAIFADKADISEEIIRIQSHIQQFEDALGMNEPIGRKLDFLVQELNRETNTIGSKANDRLIAKNVVELKSLIEKLKEQVQNIE